MQREKFKIIVFQLIPSLLLLTFMVAKWNELTLTTKKQAIVCLGLVLTRLDNILTLKSVLLRQTNYETQATIIMIICYFIDVDKNSDINDDIYGELFSILFYSLLIFNLIVYALIILLLNIFIVTITVLYLKGDQLIELNINNCIQFNLIEGLTQQELATIQLNNFAFIRELQQDQNNINIECSICLVEFIPTDQVYQLPKCKHIFHEECIKQWFNKQIKCPNCRANIRNDLQQ